LNGFTEKEYTCYYGKVLAEHLPRAVDVLADMVLNSVLSSADIELEKRVVLEEIKRHEDTPDDLVHDLFAETVWQGHPLGNSVIGRWESVESLGRDDLLSFIASHHKPDSIVLSAAGNLVHQEVVEQATSLFGHLSGAKSMADKVVPNFTGDSVLADKSTEQVHFCMGAPGFSQLDDEKYTLAVIDATLGGGMSSRLFQEIREKRGLVYAIGSYSAAYRDGGLFAVYGGTSPESMDQVLRLVRREFRSILRHNITDEELERAKNQIRGGLVLSQESMSSRMMRIARSEMYFDRVIPLDEVIACIQSVTHDDVARVADKVFQGSVYPVAAVGPFKNRKAVVCE
jgi:predicted Zn-dependent peptidase